MDGAKCTEYIEFGDKRGRFKSTWLNLFNTSWLNSRGKLLNVLTSTLFTIKWELFWIIDQKILNN